MVKKTSHSSALLTLAVGLGVGITLASIYISGLSHDGIVVEAEGGSGQCDQQYNACLQARGSNCEQSWQSCMQKCQIGGGVVGACNQDPECQLHCTESATSQGGRISCCEGGPKHQNSCPNQVDGKCNPKQTQLGGDQQSGGQQGQGQGEGKMPELPKPPGGGGGSGGGQQPQNSADCTQWTQTEGCQKSGVSDALLNGLSGQQTESTQANTGNSSDNQNPLQKLWSWVTGGSDQTSSPAPSENTNTDSGSSAVSQSVSSGSAQISGTSGDAQASQPSTVAAFSGSGSVTGFAPSGSSGASSGLFTAASQILSGISVTLQNIWNSLF